MKRNDPTYLRSIYDGLSSSKLQKDNPANLPEGLIGIYEEALPTSENIIERKRFLDFFTVWVLLKKEVSISFVLPLLENWTEEQVSEYIAKYSKWFNSPVSGLYTLYHERLRTFLLQKISHQHFTACNNSIIKCSQAALDTKLSDEWEYYALEYLSTHLLIPAMESGNASDLKALSYNVAHWNRQIEISNQFDWSKKMLDEVMQWALKYDEDEIINCSLSKVDLNYLELNDAPRIISLVANGEIDIALKRIENFGDSDGEGVRRKFILYMLCLMEFTFLDSKHKYFRKSTIEALLNHLDENLPIDHSILAWDKFFSSQFMFQMACEWAEMGLDYLKVYRRANDYGKVWMAENGPYDELSLGVLIAITRDMPDDRWKCSSLKDIAVQLFNQNQLEESSLVMKEALAVARFIGSSSDLSSIAARLFEQDKVEESLSVLRESLAIARIAGSSSSMVNIAAELYRQGQVEESLIIIHESLAIARGLRDDKEKTSAINDITLLLGKQGQNEQSKLLIQEALFLAQSASSNWEKDNALEDIAIVQCKQGNLDDSISIVRSINDGRRKSIAFKEIAFELYKQGQVEVAISVLQESLSIARGLTDNYWKCSAMSDISKQLFKQGQLVDAASVMDEALEVARAVGSSRALNDISIILAKNGKKDESISIARSINNDREKREALEIIAKTIVNQGLLNEAFSLLQESLYIARGLRDESDVKSRKNGIIKVVCVELAKKGLVRKSIDFAQHSDVDITNGNIEINETYEAIIVELAKQNMVQESLDIAQGISNDFCKNSALTSIVEEISKLGRVKESLVIANEITDVYWKSISLLHIYVELFMQRKVAESSTVMQASIVNAQSIGREYWKCKALNTIGKEMFKHGQLEVSLSLIHESLTIARGMKSNNQKSGVLRDIAIELSKQGKLEEALAIARDMDSDFWKSRVLNYISVELSKQSMYNESILLMQESLTVARRISDEMVKGLALNDIANDLSQQDNWDLAEKIGFEIPEKSEQHDCWKLMAKAIIKRDGWEKGIESVYHFHSDEAKHFYLKGCAAKIEMIDLNDQNINKILPIFFKDPTATEMVLQKHAIQKVIFSNPSQSQIERFNRTLNIQWAIDIKHTFYYKN